jgi:hypothetical protein
MNPQGYPQQGYPQQPGYGAPQAPPPKKGMSGCLLAVLIAGGVGLVLCVIVGVVVWKATKVITAAAEEGLNAPGTAEMRKAGCDAAVILDLSKLSSLFDAGATSGSTAGIVVSCAVNAGHTAPACDDLAKTYVKAVPTPGNNFVVQVTPQGGLATCKKVYSPKGTFLRDER